jgi:hypothetical protein
MLNFCMCIWTQILNLNLVWNYKFQIEFKKEKNRKLKRKEKKGRGIPAPGPKNTLASPTPFHASPLPLLSHAAHVYVVTQTAWARAAGSLCVRIVQKNETNRWNPLLASPPFLSAHAHVWGVAASGSLRPAIPALSGVWAHVVKSHLPQLNVIPWPIFAPSSPDLRSAAVHGATDPLSSDLPRPYITRPL